MKFLLFVFIFALACDEQCKPATSRCDDTHIEVCNGDGKWESILDCADYDEQCCEVDVNDYECMEVCK